MSLLKGFTPVEIPTASNFIAIGKEECSQQSLIAVKLRVTQTESLLVKYKVMHLACIDLRQ